MRIPDFTRIPKVSERLLQLMAWRKSSELYPSLLKPADEPPLRAELYSVDQLERHAKTVAVSHRLAVGRASDKLLPRLQENELVLVSTYDLVTAAAGQNRRIEPAAEWLLDNYYLIEDQIRSVRRLFSPSYSRELPRLASGPAAGYPRVYGIALELIAHVDGRVDSASLNGFIASYQSVESLKLGELWALPLMLRLRADREFTPCLGPDCHGPPRARHGRCLGRENGQRGRTFTHGSHLSAG